MMSAHGMMHVSFAVNGDAIDASPGFTIGTCAEHMLQKISLYVMWTLTQFQHNGEAPARAPG